MEIERSAASVEEAVEAALEELGLSEQEVEVEIVQEPRSGFLGLKAQPAVVRVRPRKPGTAVAEAMAEEGDLQELEEQADLAADFLEGLLEAMALEATVEFGAVEGVMYVDVFGEESAEGMAMLIGKHGHTLDALQELVRGAVQRVTGERCRVLVDVEDYRKRRREQLERRALQVASKVRASGRPQALEAMNSYDRKVVHDAVGRLGGLETHSEGEEPNRRVVIRKGSP